jgi:hypothetical protein
VTSTTLLHFLVETVETNFHKVLGFLDELKYCEEASKVNKTELMSDFSIMKKGLKQFDILSGEDNFVEIIKEFQKEASNKFDQVEKVAQEFEQAYESVVLFYSENSKTMQPNEFFKIFSTFTISWQVSSKRVMCVEMEENSKSFFNRNVPLNFWYQSKQEKELKHKRNMKQKEEAKHAIMTSSNQQKEEKALI